MKLSELLMNIQTNSVYEDREVISVTDKSSEIVEGCVFVCIKGGRFDGHSVAAKAQLLGAAAVICEHSVGVENEIIVENTRSAYSKICAAYFGNPSTKLHLIGVTGTNGKTTTTFIIKSILETLGEKVGLVGTVKNCVGDKEYEASLTTPDSKDLQKLFSEMVYDDCKYCVMEVSSQALAQGRVDGCHFDAALFTNLTQDHLDYHGSIENYMAAKHKLFEMCDKAIINADDKAAEYMVEGTSCEVTTFSVKSDFADYTSKNIVHKPSRVQYDLVGKDNIGRAHVNIPGGFTVYNSMGAVICLTELGFEFSSVLSALRICMGVPGRVEIVPTETEYTVLIDYAHTPDGLENVISAMREVSEARIITVFGCGGDRDSTKRPIMGKIAGELSDVAVVTSDNPRTEDPDAIIDQIVAGMDNCKARVVRITDRTEAIRYALKEARKDDVVLLCGKGHETYQVLADGKIHFDEREIVKGILNEASTD